MAKIIERKLNTQHGAIIMTISSNYSTSRDNNKYVHSEKDEKKYNPIVNEENLEVQGTNVKMYHYANYRIKNGQQVEVQNIENEIVVAYNSYSDSDESL